MSQYLRAACALHASQFIPKLCMRSAKFASQRFAIKDGEVLVLEWTLLQSAPTVVPSESELDVDAQGPCTVLLLHHGVYGRSDDLPGYSYNLPWTEQAGRGKLLRSGE